MKNSDSKNLLEGEASKGEDGKEMSDGEVESKLRKLYDEKKAIYVDLGTAQAREKKTEEENLYGVCSQSISNHKFGNASEDTLFDAVVIDEAAQALEPATLIPLQLLKSKGTKCIMVGDPKQLPATVLSNVASKYLYQCSMFERLQRAGHPVIMLMKQYRMHPEICRFPSLHFYDSKLLNGDLMSSKAAPFHETEGLGPYVFFDVIDGQELRGKNSGALSLYNECEADAAVEVLQFFRKRYPSEFVGGRIGIITPYRCQLSLLRSRFSSAFGSSVTAEMEFNTVDGFQGREVDILVLSTVRAAEPCSSGPRMNYSNIGFVADARRMNVALTRAKVSLWILGNARTLQTNENWAALVGDAKERKLLIPVTKPYDVIFKSALKKYSASENSDDRSRNLKHAEKVKRSSRHAELQHKNAKHSYERKRKYMITETQSAYSAGGDEHDCLATGDAFKGKKRRAREEHDSVAKMDLTSVAGNRVNEDMKSTSTGDQVIDRGYEVKKTNEKLLSMGDSAVAKRKGRENRSNLHQSEPVSGDGQKVVMPVGFKGLAESSEHDKRQISIDIRITSPERGFQQRDGDDRTRAPNQVDIRKDAITKRKQQREAVDALLSSALISSKKTEISSKPVTAMRHLPPTNTAGHAIKPPKPRKVQLQPASVPSTTRSETHQYHRKRDKSLKSLGIG
ncbi:unnamed protein product [Ilex paraguariensis]|uniref:Uncharacterized protein n=1 Tax=Ilex paraguariensis TaxID=185542 RepID=A0ABC8SA08_9AQUA